MYPVPKGDLALADRHIAVTEASIARQVELISGLVSSGQNPAPAESLLAMTKRSLAATQRYRELILEKLATRSK